MERYHQPDQPPEQPDNSPLEIAPLNPLDAETRPGVAARLAAWKAQQAHDQAAYQEAVWKHDRSLYPEANEGAADPPYHNGPEREQWQEMFDQMLEQVDQELEQPESNPRSRHLHVPPAIYGYPGDPEDGDRPTGYEAMESHDPRNNRLFVPPAIYGQPGDVQRDADGYYPDSYRLEPPREQE